MHILSLDISTKTGWAYFEKGVLKDSGLFKIDTSNLWLTKKPTTHPEYPLNFLKASEEMGQKIQGLLDTKEPHLVVIENVTLGRNRDAQRILEFCHKAALDRCVTKGVKVVYMNPSKWRSICKIKFSEEEKEKNKQVKLGMLKGKVSKKHLSVNFANNRFGLNLKVSTGNDIADAINLGLAMHMATQDPTLLLD